MPWPKTGATQYHGNVLLLNKGHAIKGLYIWNSLRKGVSDWWFGLLLP